MYTGLKLAIIVSAIVVLLSIVAPLAVFVSDFLENPACMEITGRVVEEINETHYLVEFEVKYCSSIEAKDVRLVVGESTIYAGTLEKGSKTLQVVLGMDDLEKGFRSIELSIAGLYRLKIEYR